MLLGTLGASLLGNILAGKEINRAEKSWGINIAGERVVRASLVVVLLEKCIFNAASPILKYKNIIKMSWDLMVFILEIIYPK